MGHRHDECGKIDRTLCKARPSCMGSRTDLLREMSEILGTGTAESQDVRSLYLPEYIG